MSNLETLTTLNTQDKYKENKATRTRQSTGDETKGKRSLFLIRHMSCYSYSPASVLSAIKERYILRKNEKIRCHLRYEQRILILIIHTVIVNCRTELNVISFILM